MKTVLALLALTSTIFFLAKTFPKRANGTDFPEFYAAARMVWEGYGHDLYNVRTQDEFQIRYARRIGTYNNHPPFETLVYLPFCLASLPTAYLLWCLFNGGLLAYTSILLQRHGIPRLEWQVLLPLFLVFPPVLLNFLQGQDSLLLLLLMTLAVCELKVRRNFQAGCWLACGLFKFHLILTFLVLVASLGKKGLLRGFVLVSAILLFLSAGISGWGFLTAYPRFLIEIRSLPFAGIHAEQMANVRGLVDTSHVARGTVAQFALVLMISVLLFGYAWSRGKSMQSKLGDAEDLTFAMFVLAAILVSYHLSPHDLSTTLLGFGLLLEHLATHMGVSRRARVTALICMGLFFLPPLHLVLLAWHIYPVACVPLLMLFVGARWLTTAPNPRND